MSFFKKILKKRDPSSQPPSTPSLPIPPSSQASSLFVPRSSYVFVNAVDEDGNLQLGVLRPDQAEAYEYCKGVFRNNEIGGIFTYGKVVSNVGGPEYAVLKKRNKNKYFIQLGDTKYHEIIEDLEGQVFDEPNKEEVHYPINRGGGIKKKTRSKRRTLRRK